MQNNESNETPKITRGERIQREAKKQANDLADTFDLRDCLHLEAFDFDPSDEDDDDLFVELPYVLGKRGQSARVSIDDLTDALRDWLREILPSRIASRLIEEHLNQEDLLP